MTAGGHLHHALMLAICVIASSLAIPEGMGDSGWGPAGARADDLVKAWSFGREDDRDFDGYPDDWERAEGRAYPQYVRLGIEPHNLKWQAVLRQGDDAIFRGWQWCHDYLVRFPWLPELPLPPSLVDKASDWYLEAELDGGAVMCTSPPFDVASPYSYWVRGRVMTADLVHDRAWLELAFFDADGDIVGVVASSKYGGPEGAEYPSDGRWQAVVIPAVTVPPDAVRGAVRLRLEPQAKDDMRGRAGFDEVEVVRMPRIHIEGDEPRGLYTQTASPVVRCFVSGLATESSSVRFRLFDENDQELASDIALLRPQSPNSDLSGATSEPASHSGAVAEWTVPMQSPGFYRVRASLADTPNTEQLNIEHTFAVLSDLPVGPGPFGWSLASDKRKQIELRTLPSWLADCRVQWVKYPCWVAPDDFRAADEIARVTGRLTERNIEVVGMLCNPPASVLQALNARAGDPAAILLRDSTIWQPQLEPVMARLTNGVQWWQLGAERDYSFLGRTRLQKTLGEIRTKLQGYGPPIQLVLNWPWLDGVPSADESAWQAVCLGDDTAPTAGEIDAYFESLRSSEEMGGALAGGDASPGALSNADSGQVTTVRQERLVTVSGPGGSLLMRESTERIVDSSRQATRRGSKAGEQGETEPAFKPWLLLDPLPADRYTRSDRIRDLVERMIAVRRHQIPAAFVSDPFDPRFRMLRADGTPEEMLLPWRTTAALIADLRPVGSLDLPNGSPNVLFINDTKATLVVWSDRAEEGPEGAIRESMYLGANAKQIDAYGRELPIEQVNQRGYPTQQIRVFREPTFVTNVDRVAALWSMNVRLTATRLDSLLGREQVIGLEFDNPDRSLVNGSLRIDAPEAWNVDPEPRPISIESGGARVEPIRITLRNDATVGSAKLALDFEIQGETQRAFTVFRQLDIGPEDLRIDITTKLVDGQLLVRQEITNDSSELQRFDCFVYPPQRRRSRKFATVPPGATVVLEYWWRDGRELLGKTLRLRANQENASRALNFEFIAKP